jgi:hypothetical protein
MGNLIYIWYFFLRILPLTPFLNRDELWHENFVNLVISIHHNFFGISFIHTFQLVGNFIETFNPFIKFHPCTCNKIFPHIIPTWHGDILKVLYIDQQNIPNKIVHAHRLMLIRFRCLLEDGLCMNVQLELGVCSLKLNVILIHLHGWMCP